jgi:hypothetical protein
MSFLDRAKAAAEQVKAKAQEGVEEVQTKKELTQAYLDLGHKAYELSSQAAIAHPEMDPLVQRVRDLESRAGGAAAQPM